MALGLLLSLFAVTAAFADQGNCISTMRTGYVTSVKARDKAIGVLCQVKCAAYWKAYCDAPPGPDAVVEQVLNRFHDLETQQDALLKPNAVIKPGEIDSSTVQTHALEIQETAKKRVSGLLLTQANDVEDNFLKPVMMKAEREWQSRFTHLKENLEMTVKWHPELKKNPCQDPAGIVANKDALLDAMEDMVRAVHEGQECLEEQAQALKSPTTK